jgi:hypothetical protein
MVMTDTMSEKSSRRSSTTDDVEGQPILRLNGTGSGSPLAAEYRTNMSTKLVYLASYFLLNLSLTLYNKALLGNVSL